MYPFPPVLGGLGPQIPNKIGFWLDDYNLDSNGRRHKGRAFIPWTSCLYLEENKENRGKSGKQRACLDHICRD